MLKDLEEKGPGLGCNGFGVSVTTLEEVFLKVAKEEDAMEEQKEVRKAVRRLSVAGGGEMKSNSYHKLDDPEQADDQMKLLAAAEPSGTCRQIMALVTKRCMRV